VVFKLIFSFLFFYFYLILFILLMFIIFLVKQKFKMVLEMIKLLKMREFVNLIDLMIDCLKMCYLEIKIVILLRNYWQNKYLSLVYHLLMMYLMYLELH